VVVKGVKILAVFIKVCFLTSRATVSFKSRTVLHEVGLFIDALHFVYTAPSFNFSLSTRSHRYIPLLALFISPSFEALSLSLSLSPLSTLLTLIPLPVVAFCKNDAVTF
jgi:hypothetical protein